MINKLFSFSNSCRESNKNLDKDLMDSLFLENPDENRYLKYKSIEDLNIEELNDVLNNKEKLGLLEKSALTNFFDNQKPKLDIMEEYINSISFDIKNINKEKNTRKLEKKYSNNELNKKIKKRKTDNQIKILTEGLKIYPNWNKNVIEKLSQQTKLSTSQIYKWKWDNL